MRRSDGKALGVLGVVLLLVVAGWGVSAVHHQMQQRQVADARHALTSLSWPPGYAVEPGGDSLCQVAPDRLCVTTTSNTQAAALVAARVLGVKTTQIRRMIGPTHAPTLYVFQAQLAGITASITVLAPLVVDTTGPKTVATFPGSIVSVWLVD